MFPCNECAKKIIQNGIKEVIYLSDKYKGSDENTAAKKLFDVCGVEYNEYPKEKEKVLRLSLRPNEAVTREE